MHVLALQLTGLSKYFINSPNERLLIYGAVRSFTIIQSVLRHAWLNLFRIVVADVDDEVGRLVVVVASPSRTREVERLHLHVVVGC
jgi:hypothetical protein